jgi:hypothetical protein
MKTNAMVPGFRDMIHLPREVARTASNGSSRQLVSLGVSLMQAVYQAHIHHRKRPAELPHG